MYAASYGGAVHFTGDCATGTRVSSYLVMLHVDAYIHGYTISPPASIQELSG